MNDKALIISKCRRRGNTGRNAGVSFSDIPSPYEMIVDYIKGIKFNTKSVVKETGLKVGTNKDINPNWVKNTSKDTVIRVAEDIKSGILEHYILDVNDIRDVIIEVLQYNSYKDYGK